MSRKETNFETLECGTSLAEREFGEESLPLPTAQKVMGKLTTQSDSTSGKVHLSSIESLRSLIASDVLTDGNFTTFTSPFEDPSSPGSRKRFIQLPLVYCDQTASNRPVQSIERYMENICLPFYGNTHTNTSITGSQSTAFVAEARQIVAEETNAKITGKASLDVVLFSGNGATSAVELLVDCLGFKHACRDQESRPVVFIGPYEHHSNLIPWRESGCEIVMVPECPVNKQVDISKLEEFLQQPKYKKRLKMGTFTAASNVTGKVTNTLQIASILHRHGALAFFDFATAAPYQQIDMNPPPSDCYPSASIVSKDAVFLSPHKMLGGAGTPGVLIMKKHLVSQSNAPSRSGGGTVFYVTNTHHRFLSNRIERYEGGTPNVAGIIRVGLAFLLKRKADEKYRRLLVGSDAVTASSGSIPRTMVEYDYMTYSRVSSYLREHAPNLILLGRDEGGQNLPIFSFLIRKGKRFLHYNYVCAILNDVFGIQSRGGCQCSGPYSQRLMGLTDMTEDGEVPNSQSRDIEEALLKFKERAELLRPGYTRISLPFKGLLSEEVDYVMKALVWVSKHGWALMSQYRCNHRTGEWRHWNRQGRPLGRTERRWLGHYDFISSAKSRAEESITTNPDVRSMLEDSLSTADAILGAAISDQRNIAQALKMSDAEAVIGADADDKLEKLRWYVYPKECTMDLSHGAANTSSPVETGEVIGALNPSRPVTGLTNVPSKNSEDGDAECRKEETDANRGIRKSENDQVRGAPGDSELLYFRDGDHCGEASLAEIRNGIDEGELTEQCLIFHPQSNTWVPIDSPLYFGKTPTTFSNDEPAPETREADVKLPSKKETRDSSSWGKGQTLLPNLHTGAMQCDSGCERTGEDYGGTAEAAASSKPNTKIRHVKPPPKMMRLCTQAMIQWDMLADGDRLLLGLSGGKDSMSLLHCLLAFQRKLPIKFDIEVCTIDPMTPSFDPSPLIPYVESLGLKYHYIRDDIVSRASTAGKDGKVASSLCSYCARMKRGNLYACARRNNCNKLVLAQHLDDCAESFMMSVMHNGFLRTMKAHYQINSGDISVIRPLIYCRESLMTEFVKSSNLPVINENCPACFEEPKERARIKKMLSREETLYPCFFDNIRRSLIPMMHSDSGAILRMYTEEVLSKSQKKNQPNRRKRQREEETSKTEANALPPVDCTTQKPKAGLQEFSDDDLLRELTRRKAEKYRLSGAMKSLDGGDGEEPMDPAGQVCSLTGGNGTVPCFELME